MRIIPLLTFTALKSSEPIKSCWFSSLPGGTDGGAPVQVKSMTYHYLQTDIVESANKPQEPMSLAKLLDISRGENNVLNCAKMLQGQLPTRLAKCIKAFHALPFIVGSNPSLLRCQELYISAFQFLNKCPPVVDNDSEADFNSGIQEFLDNHKEVISLLSQGFKEAGKYIQDKNTITKFLDETMKSRLGIRLLCDHYIQLPLNRKGYIGSIETKFAPRHLAERKAREAKLQCESKYGSAPEVRVTGHLDVSFMYISPPLDYILHELLKNSMRAIMEFRNSLSSNLPPVMMTIANNDTDFCFRVSDRGGGIRHDLISQVWEYGFSSPHSYAVSPNIAFDLMSENTSSGVMFGYGFGLPICKAFIEHLGGELKMVVMPGYGTDIYIRLPHIEGKEGNFLI